MSFLNLPWTEARELHYRNQCRDPEAQAFFSSLFGADTACWLCDRPVGLLGTTCIFPDPKTRGATAILACECISCHSAADRRARERAMLRSIWPGVKFRAQKDLAIGYMRGPRVKANRR